MAIEPERARRRACRRWTPCFFTAALATTCVGVATAAAAVTTVKPVDALPDGPLGPSQVLRPAVGERPSETRPLLLDVEEQEVQLAAADACPIEDVVVYADRAEVERAIDVQATAAGVWSVLIHGLTSRMDEGSLRVKPASGNGATILEVGSELLSADADATAADAPQRAERARLEAELLAAQAKMEANRDATRRASKSRELVETYCTAVAQQPATSSAPAATPSPPPIEHALELYAQRAAALDEQLRALATARQAVEAEAEALRERIRALSPGGQAGRYAVRVRVSVSRKSAPIRLRLRYLVSGARWTPAYDVRADTLDSTASLQLSYYGLVTNDSGEDWARVRLALSTAQPAAGGTPPTLPPVSVRYARPQPAARAPRAAGALGLKRTAARSASKAFVREAVMEEEVMEEDAYEEPVGDAPPVATTSAFGSGAGSTRFGVQHAASISADGRAHKVTVALIELTPTLVHTAVPSLDARAFVRATANNTSPYPLLPSSACSVFVDGSFVASTELRGTMPGEALALSLGPDPRVHVQGVPRRDKEGAASGLALFSAATRHVTSEMVAVIANTQPAHAVTVHVAMPLPRSSHEQISVTLLEPARAGVRTIEPGTPEAQVEQILATGAGASGAAVYQRPDSTLVWVVRVPGGAQHTVRLVYRIDHPADRPIEFD